MQREADALAITNGNEDIHRKIVFNRAFLYAVRHNPTGLLLMIGRYVHP